MFEFEKAHRRLIAHLRDDLGLSMEDITHLCVCDECTLQDADPEYSCRTDMIPGCDEKKAEAKAEWVATNARLQAESEARKARLAEFNANPNAFINKYYGPNLAVVERERLVLAAEIGWLP